MEILLICVTEWVHDKFCAITPASGFTLRESVVSASLFFSNTDCPAQDGWEAALENTVQERFCGSNTEYRQCSFGGVWGDTDSSNCCMR